MARRADLDIPWLVRTPTHLEDIPPAADAMRSDVGPQEASAMPLGVRPVPFAGLARAPSELRRYVVARWLLALPG